MLKGHNLCQSGKKRCSCCTKLCVLLSFQVGQKELPELWDQALYMASLQIVLVKQELLCCDQSPLLVFAL